LIVARISGAGRGIDGKWLKLIVPRGIDTTCSIPDSIRAAEPAEGVLVYTTRSGY
jgi:hypothetical protein